MKLTQQKACLKSLKTLPQLGQSAIKVTKMKWLFPVKQKDLLKPEN